MTGINSLIILPSKHITKMANRRIMHDRNLIPPLLAGSIRSAPRIHRRFVPRGDYIADQLRSAASLARDGHKRLPVLGVALFAVGVVEMEEVEHGDWARVRLG